MSRRATAALLLLTGLTCTPAQAETAADCAAFWRGVAAEQRALPGLGVAPDEAETLAAAFEALPEAGPVATDRIAGYRLLYRGLIAGDRQSTDLFSRIAERCDALLPRP
ncbi:hypothetical protein M4578_18225 [Salipiger sp. P9]|uniref:hypothetical protein n=1 Tax=Salipiger pentaromativorans TaxID=2943193 RepID=UPI0021570A40|nr:hypothetical protein [Salipiger pentaromativorans]MCR8549772.1 hypothetical protein [Salipiger pentaromativorans]